jgi:hypothetical protein
MRPKVLLSVIVCLALLFSFGVAVKDAKADAIMFPWVVKSATVSTIISVVNTSGAVGILFPGVYDIGGIPLTLHYQYIYKAVASPEVFTDPCLEVDFTRQTSLNDIVTFDAAGLIGGGKPLFNDNALNTPYTNLRFDMGDGVAAPARAYLLVDNTTGGVTPGDGALYGEAILMELNEGAAWGYIAYNASGSQSTTALNFSDGNDLYGEVINQLSPGSNPGPEYTPVVLLNPNDATTKFFVTPIDGGLNFQVDPACSSIFPPNAPNQRQLNINTQIQFVTFGTSGFNGGIYDNDEEILSFTSPKNVVCTAALTLDKIMDSGVFVPWKNSGHQGWTILLTNRGTVNANGDDCYDNSETGACVGKLEYSVGSSSFQAKTVPGAFNTFNWLRNNLTVTGPGGLNLVSELGQAD